jgi:hypothetical protein
MRERRRVVRCGKQPGYISQNYAIKKRAETGRK